MKSYLQFTGRILGLYAAILAFVHGIFELQQGKGGIEGVQIQAVGNSCVADQIWHACFPAITIWPTYFIAGLITIILSVSLFLLILLSFNKRVAGWVILGFAAANLLSGGGFIPTFTACMAAVALFLSGIQKQGSGKQHGLHIILWSILLIIYVLYAATGWLFGVFFNTFMIENSFPLFFVMDLLIPILCIILASTLDRHTPSPAS